jgi:inositol-1,3,4-trisphosphate 5/6-kinase/inositol-tetrakisphosphate 1-kinase
MEVLPLGWKSIHRDAAENPPLKQDFNCNEKQKKSLSNSGLKVANSGHKVAVFLNEVERNKINYNQFSAECQSQGLSLHLLHHDAAIDPNVSYDAVIHKSYKLKGTFQFDSNVEAGRKFSRFQEFVARNPKTIVIDPWDCLEKIFSRDRMCHHIDEALKPIQGIASQPLWAILPNGDVDAICEILRKQRIQFPIIMKEMSATGSSTCHHMAVVLSKEHLSEWETYPCVAQEYINHDARMWKVFVIGNHYYQTQRPSTKNFSVTEPQNQTLGKKNSFIHFDSQLMTKVHSDDPLNKLDSDDAATLSRDVTPDDDVVHKIVQRIDEQLGLSLYGLDVILEKPPRGASVDAAADAAAEAAADPAEDAAPPRTNPQDLHHYVLDVNDFPGYQGVPNFTEMAIKLLKEKIEGRL